MNNAFFKGLIVAVLAAISTLLTNKDAGISYWAISILGVVLTYFGQHAVLKAVSLFGTINLMDLVKGLAIALGAGISTYIASIVDKDIVDWNVILQMSITTTLLYLGRNFVTNSQGAIGREEVQPTT